MPASDKPGSGLGYDASPKNSFRAKGVMKFKEDFKMKGCSPHTPPHQTRLQGILKRPLRSWSAVLTALLVLLACPAIAQTYRWIDKAGRVHYSQTPPPADARDVQKRVFGGPAVEVSSLPYATQVSARNFPITLYSAPACGAPCDQLRNLLVKRSVPFREVSVIDEKRLDELKQVSGKSDVPVLMMGAQLQAAASEEALMSALDHAGYPRSSPPLPLEALRRMDAEPKPAEAAPPQAAAAPPPEDAPK